MSTAADPNQMPAQMSERIEQAVQSIVEDATSWHEGQDKLQVFVDNVRHEVKQVAIAAAVTPTPEQIDIFWDQARAAVLRMDEAQFPQFPDLRAMHRQTYHEFARLLAAFPANGIQTDANQSPADDGERCPQCWPIGTCDTLTCPKRSATTWLCKL